MSHSQSHSTAMEILSTITGADLVTNIIIWGVIILMILPPALRKIDDGWKYLSQLFRRFLEYLGVQFKDKKYTSEESDRSEHQELKKMLEDQHNHFNQRFDQHEITAAETLKINLAQHEEKVLTEMGHVREVINTRVDGLEGKINEMGTWVNNVEKKADAAEKGVSYLKGRMSSGANK